MTMSPLPTFHSAYDLDARTIAAYRAHGFACVRGLAAADELNAVRPLIAEATMQWRYDKRPLEERETYGRAFIQTMNLWQRDPRLAAFSLAPRFARVAASLMGVDAVRIYHDQALFKEPGGGYTPWHQDQTYWPLDTTNTITLWMPLVDVPDDVGSMHFVDGSHRHGDLGTPGIGDHSQAYFEELIRTRGWQTRTFGGLLAGDATFHSGWTLHSAAANPTALMREVMTVIYFADGTRVAEPRYKSQRHDMKAWLPGCAPGDIAASPLNPRL